MKKIDTTTWKPFRVGELFDIHPTKAYKFTNSILFDENGTNPVVVNSSYNNGIGGYTSYPTTEKGGIITFSDTTSADAIFYQREDFVGYPHIQGMYPVGRYKDCWGEKSLLFFVSIFRNRAINSHYDYVNKFTRDSAKEMVVMLPVDKTGNPDFAYMETYMQNLESAVSSSLTALRSATSSENCDSIATESWKIFVVEDIFSKIVKPKVYHTREVTESEDGIPYVVRSKFNNGIKYLVKKPSGEINPPKVISFGAENATFFYQESEWVSGRDIYYIDTRDIDKYACLFITACLQPIAAKYSYNFGLFPDLLRKEKIKLPVDNRGNPDYKYMAEFMRALEAKSAQTIQQLRLA